MTERGLLGAVYDCTIAYPDTKPSTEMAVLRGELPTQVGILPAPVLAPAPTPLYSDNQVNLHLVRHPLPSLPTTYVGLEKWLEERWRDKVTTNSYHEYSIEILVKVKY